MRNCVIIHPLHLELETAQLLNDTLTSFMSNLSPYGVTKAQQYGVALSHKERERL